MTRTLGIPAACSRFTLPLLLSLATMIPGSARPAAAGPIGWQATGGYFSDRDKGFVGAGARIGAGTITVIPNADWLFVDNGKQYTLNLDGTMSVMPLGVASIYAGGGVGWWITDPDQGSHSTDTIWNLIAGAGLNTFPLKPFGQLKYLVANGTNPIQFAAGIRF